MQYLSVVLPVAAMVSGALAGPAWGDACLAAVTGSSALGDAGLRASHCKSYLATTVTPIATTTVYLTGHANENWKRSTVALCPNEVPNYASACDDAHYSSACSVFGYTDVITTTVAPTTTTKTIWIKPTGGAGTCTATTVTKAGETSTVTVGGDYTVTSTVVTATTVTEFKDGSLTWSATTVTVTDAATATTVTETETETCTASTASTPASSCSVDAPLATKLVNNFAILLSQTATNGGYNQEVSNETLDPDSFVDISDSINFMSLQVALGDPSFTSKDQFDQGQGNQPAVAIDVLNIWPGCSEVTWRWRIPSSSFFPLPVVGISHFTVNEKGLIDSNWVEFDNGAWLQNYGQNCSFGSQLGAPGPAVSSNPVRRSALLY